MFGYPREELLGRPVEVLIPAQAHAAHVRHYAPIGVALIALEADGSGRFLDVNRSLLQRVRSGSTVTSNGRRIQVSASIGVALFGAGFDLTSEMVLANADAAMYQAKAAGRKRVTLFEASNEPEAQPARV